jgi:hypothetical protein
MPTGEPNCTPHVIFAKCIYRRIVEATDGSMGGSDLGGDLQDDNNDKVKEDHEEDYGEDFLASIDGDDDVYGKGDGHVMSPRST